MIRFNKMNPLGKYFEAVSLVSLTDEIPSVTVWVHDSNLAKLLDEEERPVHGKMYNELILDLILPEGIELTLGTIRVILINHFRTDSIEIIGI